MARPPQTHETHGRTEDVKVGGDRAFGVVFAVVFAVIALWPLTGGGEPRLWASVVAAAFLIVSLPFLNSPISS